MTQKWPSVQVTHSANVGLIGIVLFLFGAAFLPALPRGDGVVFAALRPHLLRPREVLRRGDDALDGLGDGFDEERRNALLYGINEQLRRKIDCFFVVAIFQTYV